MKKKLLSIGGMALAVTVLCGCGKTAVILTTSEKAMVSEETTSVTEVPASSETITAESTDAEYRIKVTDLDGEEFADETFTTREYPTVKSALESIGLTGYEGSYGYSITSISGSIVDANYYMAIYENGEYASTGVDGLVIDDGDVFSFTNECWNTTASGYGVMDSYDVLVDKALYHRVKAMRNILVDATTYSDSMYWERNLFYHMKSEGYDENLFSSECSSLFADSVTSADMTSLTGASYAKWYYAARYMGVSDYDAFTTYFKDYLSSLTAYGTYDEYTLPFNLSVAKTLGLDSSIADDVKNTTYRADTTYGPDGLAWELAGLAEYQDVKEELSLLTEAALSSSYSADISLASYLMAYASSGVNARDYTIAGKDVITYLFDTYYDQEAMAFTTEKSEGDYSSNQIYAALAAYKISRDKNKAVDIFA